MVHHLDPVPAIAIPATETTTLAPSCYCAGRTAAEDSRPGRRGAAACDRRSAGKPDYAAA
jgi:hypothetical protein